MKKYYFWQGCGLLLLVLCLMDDLETTVSGCNLPEQNKQHAVVAVPVDSATCAAVVPKFEHGN